MLRSKEKFFEIPKIDGEEIRKSIIDRIEEITLEIIEEIGSKNFPKITYCDIIAEIPRPLVQKTPDTRIDPIAGPSNAALRGNPEDSESNIPTPFDSSKSLSWVYEDEETRADQMEAGDLEADEEEAEGFETVRNSTTVDFRKKRSRKNLVLMITVMSRVHKMLVNRTTMTRRCLYYELQSEPTSRLARTQRFLDDAVNHVASLLERAPWELGFTATSKGLVCGDLVLTFSDPDTTSCCNVPGGLLIPQNIFRLTSARTSASHVIVVEKDAVFQKLLQENCPDHLNCILITGKGYPDVNTRMLVSLLGNELKLPVYILVDSDPFGIEIMCIYRFGSAVRSRERRELMCPIARWIGIHPSEYSALGISPKILTDPDETKLVSLEGRGYGDAGFSKEIQLMRRKGKVEIEAVAGLSHKFLTAVYLAKKIDARQFV